MRNVACAEERRQRSKEAVNRRRRHIDLEQRMQLVVERPGALHDGDVLRYPGSSRGLSG